MKTTKCLPLFLKNLSDDATVRSDTYTIFLLYRQFLSRVPAELRLQQHAVHSALPITREEGGGKGGRNGGRGGEKGGGDGEGAGGGGGADEAYIIYSH